MMLRRSWNGGAAYFAWAGTLTLYCSVSFTYATGLGGTRATGPWCLRAGGFFVEAMQTLWA